MIDTAIIRYTLSVSDTKAVIADLRRHFPDRKDLDTFFDYDGAKLRSFIPSVPGVETVKLYKSKFYPADSNIYLSITIDLEALCRRQPTLDLFYCSANNNLVLQHCYAEAITALLPSTAKQKPLFDGESYIPYGLSSIPYLALATVRRIDYAYNLYSDNKEAYLEMAKRTYCDGRKSQQKYDNSNTYARNGSARFSLYDKALRTETHNIELHCQAATINLIRYEVPRTKFNEEWLAKYNIALNLKGQYVGLLPFLDENIAQRYLFSEYSKSIGTADWHSDYHFKKAIEAANLKKGQKKKLLDIAQLLSQSRTISAAKENFINGYHIAKTDKTLQGTAATFTKYLKLFAQLNLQPLRIPDRFKIAHISNPINNINIPQHNHTYSGKNLSYIPDYYTVINYINNIFIS